MLHAVMHGTGTLVYNNQSFKGSDSLHLSDHNFSADCQVTLVPPFNSGAKAAPVTVHVLPVQCYYSPGTDVGCGSLETTGHKVFAIMSLTWDEWCLPSNVVTLGTIRLD